MKLSLPVMVISFFNSTSTLHSFYIRLWKQALIRFQFSGELPILDVVSLCLLQTILIKMLGEQASIFPKQIKLDDYGEFSQGNVIRSAQGREPLMQYFCHKQAIVLAKTLHFLIEEKVMALEGKTVLQLGCGAGLLGVYLGCLGVDVLMVDVPSVRDVAERNISLNKKMIKGKVQFLTANWKREGCIGKCEQMSGQSSTSSEQREECLVHLVHKVALAVVCEGGGLADLSNQLRWMGKEGMVVCFLQRQYSSPEDYLSARTLQLFLNDKGINYDRIEDYHPDYNDERVQIYKIYPR